MLRITVCAEAPTGAQELIPQALERGERQTKKQGSENGDADREKGSHAA